MDASLAFDYRLASYQKRTVKELRANLTQSEKAYQMAMWSMYPVGQEAFDVYVAAILSAIEGGIPVVQVKKGKSVKWLKNLPFKREIGTGKLGPKQLIKKAMGIFKNLGMKEKDG